jgi:uncharacterized protein (DUF2141 family)
MTDQSVIVFFAPYWEYGMQVHRIVLAAGLTSLLGAHAPVPAHAAEGASLQVAVAHLRSAEGKVWVCLWQEGATGAFPRCDQTAPFAKLSAPASAPTVVFNGVAPGAYAVSFFHDERGTGVPEVNLVGLPKSGIGTSNNPDIGLMNRPSFAKSRFVVPGTTQLTVIAKYLF